MYKNVTKVSKRRNIKIQFKYTIVRANVGLKSYPGGTLGRRGEGWTRHQPDRKSAFCFLHLGLIFRFQVLVTAAASTASFSVFSCLSHFFSFPPLTNYFFL